MRWDVVEEHLEEAAFVWGQRELACSSPDYVLAEVAGLEARLGAHVDALVLAGSPAARRVLEKALLEEEPQRVAVAALALLRQSTKSCSMVLEQLQQGAPAQQRGISSALLACGRNGLEAHLLPWLEEDNPDLQFLVLELLRHWRIPPGPVLQRLLTSRDLRVQAAAFLLAAHIPIPVAPETLKRGLASGIPSVRDAAIEVGLVFGYKEAWVACLEVVKARSSSARFPMLLAALGGDTKDQMPLLDVLSVPALQCDALWALGFSGRVQAADACLALMRKKDSLVARLAGEAFCSITGLEMKERYVSMEPPEVEEPVPLEEEDLDAELLPASEDALPLPEPDAVQQWWSRARGSFELKGRYLRGRAFSWNSLLQELEHGPMRRRPAHALEFAIRSQGEHRVSLRALAKHQLHELACAHRQEELACPSFEHLPMRRWGFAPAGAPGVHAANGESSPRAKRSISLGPQALAVRALGMVSPLGDDVVTSCAASRAGISRIGALDTIQVWDAIGEQMQPASGCSIPGLTEGFTGFGRLVRLGAAGLKDLLGRIQIPDWSRTGLFIALPSGHYLQAHEESLRREAEAEGEMPEELPGEFAGRLRRNCEQRLLSVLAQQVAPPLSQSHLRLFWQGRAGFIMALQAANEALERGRLDRCIVGGIDSLVDRPLLEALKHLNRLKAPSQPVGIVPGECAAFVLVDKSRALTTGDGMALCAINGLSFFGEEDGRGSVQAPEAGRALGQTLAATLDEASSEVTLLSGSINGEERNAYMWGHALLWLRARGLLDDPPEWHPALSFGEIGAATGPAAVCLAAHALGWGDAPRGNCLVWMVDESGARGSFLLQPLGSQ